MRRRPHPSRPPAPPGSRKPRDARADDVALASLLATLRSDYARIAPDPTFVARVHDEVAAVSRPLRRRKRRRALGLAASVLLAFLAGFVGAGGARSLGLSASGGADAARTIAARGGDLLPVAPAPRTAPPKAGDGRATADRLRALLAPLGTPAASEPETISAWKKATRDPDATLRAVARALLRASGSAVEAESPPASLIDLEVPRAEPYGDGGSPPTPAAPPPEAPSPHPAEAPR